MRNRYPVGAHGDPSQWARSPAWCRRMFLGALAVCATTSAACRQLETANEYDQVRLSPGGAGPRVLCVVAHPDDEIAFAGALYKTASHLDGRCDVAVLTNGEGGYKYSTLAERVYGLELTREAVGRAHLPAIRARELEAGCRVLGVSRIFFLGQTDHRYTTDVEEVLGADADVWELERVERVLDEILTAGEYDVVLTLAPTDGTHGHHKAATLLALRAAARRPESDRPAVLAARSRAEGEPAPTLTPLAGYAESELSGLEFEFDRTQAFGYRERLNYKVVANWAIAEHKSQGTMQLAMNGTDREHYFLFAGGPPDARARCEAWFGALAEPQFEPLEY